MRDRLFWWQCEQWLECRFVLLEFEQHPVEHELEHWIPPYLVKLYACYLPCPLAKISHTGASE